MSTSDPGDDPGDPPPSRVRVDADPFDTRDETEDEQMDRNWSELLQELRVTQTGTQILTAFLLAIAFQPRFATLTTFQRVVYLVLVGIAALTTTLGLTPVNLHRAVFRRHAKRVLVSTAHVLVRLTLLGVALLIIGVVLLIFDVTLGRGPALLAAGLTAAAVVLAALLPGRVLRSLNTQGR